MHILILISWFLIYLLCIKACGILVARYRKNNEKNVEDENKKFDILKKELEKTIHKKELLDKKSFAFGQIYEIIKKMSEALKTEDITSIFSSFLNEYFDFSKSYLIILFQDKTSKRIKKIYEITKGSPDFDEIDVFLMDKNKLNLVDIIKDNKNAKVIDKDNNIAIPLLVEGMSTAVLLIEDLKNDQKDEIFILCSQLAMELKKVSLYESVQRLSITDGLTRIYLRRYFMDRLSEEIERSERLKLEFSVLMIDIDHFKHCNDRYGHMVGDAVLKEIASIVKSNAREIDLVARYGGEEFSLLLPETGKKGAFYVAERIRKAIEGKLIAAYDENLRLTVSIGISMYPEDAKKGKSLIEKADKAMYQSKQQGRNRIKAWEYKD